MKKELAVLVIHGIGRQDENFADELKEGVSAELERLGRDPESVAWQTIFWDDILSPAQDAYLQSAFDSNELMARNNGNAAPLSLNIDGGNIVLGDSQDDGLVGGGHDDEDAGTPDVLIS